MDVVGYEADALQYATEKLRDDEDVVTAAISNRRCGYAMKYATENIRRYWDVVYLAMEDDISNLKYASAEFYRDKYSVAYVSEEFCDDEDVVIAAGHCNTHPTGPVVIRRL